MTLYVLRVERHADIVRVAPPSRRMRLAACCLVGAGATGISEASAGSHAACSILA